MSSVFTPAFGPRQGSENAFPFPTDGSSFALDQYLGALVGSNVDWYRMYDLHLQYFTSMYNIKGDKNIERIWPIFLRQVIEFGKGAIGRVNGKYIPLTVIDTKFTIDYRVKSMKSNIARVGYGLNEDSKTYNFKGEDVAFIKHNFQGLPFIFYWEKILNNIIDLRDAALTGSIASIKKFKKNMGNNSTTINNIENAALSDPRTPYITVVSDPMSYVDEERQQTQGNRNGSDVNRSTSPNAITFEGSVDSAGGQFENLQNYMEFEYYQNGRKINTNKKEERNIEKEIDTETINFDILENDFFRYLQMWVDDMNDKFGLSLYIESVAQQVLTSQQAVEEVTDND